MQDPVLLLHKLYPVQVMPALIIPEQICPRNFRIFLLQLALYMLSIVIILSRFVYFPFCLRNKFVYFCPFFLSVCFGSAGYVITSWLGGGYRPLYIFRRKSAG